MATQAVNEYAHRDGQIYELVIEQVEKRLIEEALGRCDQVKVKAADFLGINRNTLNKKVKDFLIEAVDDEPQKSV